MVKSGLARAAQRAGVHLGAAMGAVLLVAGLRLAGALKGRGLPDAPDLAATAVGLGLTLALLELLRRAMAVVAAGRAFGPRCVRLVRAAGAVLVAVPVAGALAGWLGWPAPGLWLSGLVLALLGLVLASLAQVLAAGGALEAENRGFV